MWQCPKCGREFKRTNQGHYCGKAPQTVLEYIDSQHVETHTRLTEMMTILRNSVPGVSERILWSMPYYESEGKSISFSAAGAASCFPWGAPHAVQNKAVSLILAPQFLQYAIVTSIPQTLCVEGIASRISDSALQSFLFVTPAAQIAV